MRGVCASWREGDLCAVSGGSQCQLLHPLTSSKSETWVLMSEETDEKRFALICLQ